MNVCRNAARRTEGVFPATAAKKNIRDIPTTAMSLRLRPRSRDNPPAKKDICRPDTATTWASPVRRRAEYSPPGRVLLSPVSREVTRGAASSVKQRAALSLRARDT